MEKLDVCIVTLRGLSDEFYDSLYRAIPVAQLIVDNSTKPLGKAREAVIRRVRTERFVFVDDDVFLPENWYEKIIKYWNSERVGWLEGWTIPSAPRWYRRWALNRFRKARPEILRYGVRGFTLDTIIKTDLVTDWVSPENLDFYEDLALSNHVNAKGFEVIRVPVASEHRIGYDVFAQMAKGMKASNKTIKQRASFAGNTFLSGAKASLETGDFSIAYNAAKLGWVALTA